MSSAWNFALGKFQTLWKRHSQAVNQEAARFQLVQAEPRRRLPLAALLPVKTAAARHAVCRYSMLRMGLAPCSPFTVTNDLMIKAAELARQYEGVRLHTHLAENQVSPPSLSGEDARRGPSAY